MHHSATLNPARVIKECCWTRKKNMTPYPPPSLCGLWQLVWVGLGSPGSVTSLLRAGGTGVFQLERRVSVPSLLGFQHTLQCSGLFDRQETRECQHHMDNVETTNPDSGIYCHGCDFMFRNKMTSTRFPTKNIPLTWVRLVWSDRKNHHHHARRRASASRVSRKPCRVYSLAAAPH